MGYVGGSNLSALSERIRWSDCQSILHHLLSMEMATACPFEDY